MKKQEMNNLVAGVKIQSLKTGEVLEVVGMDAEAGKYILSNSKLYATSTIKRWFDLYVEPVTEDNTDTEEQEDTDTIAPKFNLGDKVVTNFGVGEVVSVPHLVELDGKVTMSNYRVAIYEDGQRYLFDYKEEQLEAYTEQTAQDIDTTANTSDLKDTNTQVNEVHEDTKQTTNSTGKTNTVQPTIQQDNLIQSLNNLIDLHNVRLEPKREYIKVSMEGKRGALCMIRNSRYGSLHIDMKSKVFAQLTEEYRDLLIEQYGCRVYDKSRGYMRVFNCNDIEVLRTIILTAKSIA